VKEFIDGCIDGPSNCAARLNRVTDLKKNQIGGFPFHGVDVLVSRTGYTGEDGFEIVGRDDSIRRVWDELLLAGQPFGIKPCGLGARDTLRTEVCYPLYGHELDEDTSPIETGLGRGADKGDFVDAPCWRNKGRARRKLVAFKGGIAGAAEPLSGVGERRIGRCGDGGTQSPSFECWGRLARVAGLRKRERRVEIESATNIHRRSWCRSRFIGAQQGRACCPQRAANVQMLSHLRPRTLRNHARLAGTARPTWKTALTREPALLTQ
jgi:glycine cleavage system aminomethyltransferase T